MAGEGIPGVTCAKCSGRIDEDAFEMKRRVSANLGKPYTPPRVCSECVLVTMLEFAKEEDPTDAE